MFLEVVVKSVPQLLDINPKDPLRYPVLLGKKISGYISLTNSSENPVTFKVMTLKTNQSRYHVEPMKGVVAPRSAVNVIVTIQAKEEAPSYMEHKDTLLIRCQVANEGTSTKDITENLDMLGRQSNVNRASQRSTLVPLHPEKDDRLKVLAENVRKATTVPGFLVLEIDAPIYFANSNYLRERIIRWIDEEEGKLQAAGKSDSLQYIILDFSAVANIDTSGISMAQELKKILDRRGLKLALVNPGAEVMKKLNKSNFLEELGKEWIFLTVGEAIGACKSMLHTLDPKTMGAATQKWSNDETV